MAWTRQPRKLTLPDVQDALRRYSKGESIRAIARDLDVDHKALSRKIWPDGKDNGVAAILQDTLDELNQSPPEIVPVSSLQRESPTAQDHGGEIPVLHVVKGDLLRSIYLQLTGTSHRGKIQACLDDIMAYLALVDIDAWK